MFVAIEATRLKPREQGDVGELSAMEWLASQGARVAIPVFHSPDWDLIAELDSAVARVQVKTSAQLRNGRWRVVISTRGGNQSWNGLVKYFDARSCDFLFVHVGDGRRWFIPARAVDSRSGLTLGGSSYAEFEIEAGRPLVGEPRLESITTRRGSADVGESGETVNLVPRLLSGFESHLPHEHPVVAEPLTSMEPWPPPRDSRTRISRKHQITIPIGAYRGAGLQVGDRLRARADGHGRVVLERFDAQ
jgi:Holliday junction resolvase-like predicted endonuclease